MIPKTRNGPVEQIRILLVARRSARIETLNQLRHLVFTGPEEVRARFKDRYKTGLITEVAKMRPRTGSDPVLYTTMVTMRCLARRIQSLNTETKDLDAMLTTLVKDTAPSLVGLYGDHGLFETLRCERDVQTPLANRVSSGCQPGPISG